MSADISFTEIDRDAELIQGLRRALDLESFGINLMVLQPGKRLRVHTHERQDEVYLVLEGTLTLLIAWAVLWTAVAFTGYATLRRSRS